MSKRYQVPMVIQQFSPVCWLACAAMVVQFKRSYTPLASELGMRGPDFRMPGLTVPTEAASGAEQRDWLRRLGFTTWRASLGRTPVMGVGRSPRGDAGVVAQGEAAIESVLTRHGPFILLHNVGAFWYGPSPIPAAGEGLGEGHAVVVTGIDTSSHTVYFNNPWGDRDVPTTTSSIRERNSPLEEQSFRQSHRLSPTRAPRARRGPSRRFETL